VLYKNDYADGRKRLALTGLEKYHSTPGTHAILRELRKVLDEYDAFTVGESVMTNLAQARDLCGATRRELNTIFYFEHLETDRLISKYIPIPFSAKRLLKTLTKWQQGLEWNAVYLENHDQPRIVSHYGSTKSPKLWARSAKLLAMLEFGLRGTPFIYQGQEIGMTNFDFSDIDELNDVESRNMDVLMQRLHIPKSLRWHWIKLASRDNARTPMQWDSGFGAGFTDGEPWLRINANYKSINYEQQRGDKGSVLNFYKRLIKYRESSMTLKYGAFEPVYADRQVLAFEREYDGEKIQVWLNFSEKRVEAKIAGEIILSNTGRKALDGVLRAWEAVMVKNEKP
jgi:oligo-1,6-glucosidase